MFANFATIVSVLASFAAVAPSVHAAPSTGLAGRSVHKSVPAQFNEVKRNYTSNADLLEPYADYNERYDLFDCASKHNTTFWTSCCHPLMKGQNEDVLPDVCFADIPCDSTSTSAPITTSTAVVQTTVDKIAHTTSHKATTTKTPHTSTKKSTKAAQPTTSATSTSSGGAWRTGGHSTYFYQEGNAGACGTVHSDNDLIVAIDIGYYGDINSVSSTCGKKVEIVNTDTGKSVIATVADVCPTCDSINCLDMSLGTFKALDSNLGDGEFPIKYRIMS